MGQTCLISGRFCPLIGFLAALCPPACRRLPILSSVEPQGLPWGGLRVFLGPMIGEGLSSPRAQPWSATVFLYMSSPALPAALPPGHSLASRGLRACPGRPSHSLWSCAHTRPHLATVPLPRHNIRTIRIIRHYTMQIRKHTAISNILQQHKNSFTIIHRRHA
jgi:hypothetical protein